MASDDPREAYRHFDERAQKAMGVRLDVLDQAREKLRQAQQNLVDAKLLAARYEMHPHTDPRAARENTSRLDQAADEAYRLIDEGSGALTAEQERAEANTFGKDVWTQFTAAKKADLRSTAAQSPSRQAGPSRAAVREAVESGAKVTREEFRELLQQREERSEPIDRRSGGGEREWGR